MRVGLPHALVHFCNNGLAHGHMVGILLAPGLTIQAKQDPATAYGCPSGAGLR